MALDLGEFALLANLDLSSVFDVVNVGLDFRFDACVFRTCVIFYILAVQCR